MPSPTARFDVAIVGAGASGLWAALELAPDHEVLVLEAESVGDGASGSAAGFVSAFADWAPSPDAVEHAVDRFRWLDGQHGFEFDERPYVELAEDAEAAAELRASHDPLLRRDGYGLDYLDADALASRWPDLFDLSGFHGALVNEESGVVDPQSYVDALAALARERGVEIRTGTPVTGIASESGAVTGVETPDGVVAADAVVCAAGAQTDRLVEPFVDLPTRQFVYSNVRVEADRELADDYPMMYGRDLWWRPTLEDSRTLLVSGGMYYLRMRDEAPEEPPAEYCAEIAETLPTMARDVESAHVVEGSYHTCPKGSSITPDALPVLDAPAGAPSGLVIVAGVTAGISMSPFTGSAVRALVTGESAPVRLDDFALDRFDAPADSFEVHGIREPPGD